jgi:hypothetical protein
MYPKIIEHIIWHQSYDVVNRVMMHHFNGEAWKQFNRMHPQFFLKPWNIYVGLYTNEFNLFGSFVAPYSYWSVIFIIFKLLEFMLLSMFINDSNIPGRNINSYL